MPTWIWKFLINSEEITEKEKKSIIDTYRNEGKDTFLNEAKKKKVLPFVANTLIGLDLDVQFWKEILEEYRKRNTAILGVLDEAYLALKKHGVKKMFVAENFGALLSASGDIGLFSSGDVDNYADPCEKEKIYRAFAEIGYSRKERYAGKHQIAAEFFPPESKRGLPDGFYISIDFYPLARLKLPCFIEADQFVDWSKLKLYKDTSIILPPPTALMYICLLHISLHSFSRAPDIRLYIDLLNMMHTQVDFVQIEKWCKRDHTCTRAATAADLCNKLFRTKIPEEILGMSKRKEKVIKRVFSSDDCDLIYEPHGLAVLKIEIACDDFSDFHGLMSILFPDKVWLKDTYGGCGVMAHLKHFLKVI